LEQHLLDRLLAQCQERGWLKARGRQRTDSTHILGAAKALNQLELVGETLRYALNILATLVPEWMKAHAKPEWFERYDKRIEDYRLPKDKTEREALSATIGEDGYLLLDWLEEDPTLHWLFTVPAIATFASVWTQQYHRKNGQTIRLTPKEMVPVGE
jgi:transposase